MARRCGPRSSGGGTDVEFASQIFVEAAGNAALLLSHVALTFPRHDGLLILIRLYLQGVHIPVMSISFSAPDLQPTYNSIIHGSAGYDWAIYNQTGNELKVQATGSGLDDLEEEFMDGR